MSCGVERDDYETNSEGGLGRKACISLRGEGGGGGGLSLCLGTAFRGIGMQFWDATARALGESLWLHWAHEYGCQDLWIRADESVDEAHVTFIEFGRVTMQYSSRGLMTDVQNSKG